MDWRSVAGFLGDLGIGNGMAKSEAHKAVNARRAALQEVQAKRDCVKDVVPAAPGR